MKKDGRDFGSQVVRLPESAYCFDFGIYTGGLFFKEQF